MPQRPVPGRAVRGRGGHDRAVPDGPAALERGERELPLPVGRAFSAPERLRVPAGHARGMDSEPVITPVGINEDHPAFDEVTRRVRDLGDMVPV